MSFEIVPKHELFAAEIRGLDLRKPVPDAIFDNIREAIYRYAVLIFPDQDLTPPDHIAFSKLFGELHFDKKSVAKGQEYGELTVFGNMNPLGDTFTPPDVTADLEEWHSDHSHRPTPALVSMLYGCVVPDEGADTMYALMTAAYKELPPDLYAKIKDRRAVHTGASLIAWRHEVDPSAPALTPELAAEIPRVERPMIKVHPKTGAQALYFGSKIMRSIVGLNDAESRALIEELTAFATQRKFVYSHKWRKGDLVLWDNRAVIHTGTHYDRRKFGRLMQRTTVLDTPAGRV